MLIDTHTHLYSEEFAGDLESVMLRAFEAGVSTFYLPAIDSATHDAMFRLEEKYPEKCFAMMGLHPCHVKDNFREELALAEEYLQQRKFAAVGEIGLDFYWDKTFINEQYKAFEIQMQWALENKLPIVIHSRDSMQETLDFVKPFADKGLRGIFHCFGGDKNAAEQIVSMNFLLGIGGVLTYRKANLAEVLKDIPLEYIVLETDSPYLAPVPYRGKRNESAYLEYIAQALASAKNIPFEEVASITSANARKLFAI
ncbi:TatD family hydrolase [Haoranjiania flava]|uniref:TatD family hydrolase n=1 Tax=Haoranjiania flava TaxID=1856322 RepID=A0AAE3IPH7_9BACT|nr:TatD family hydrolase [Haoranjiania flava]MCU7694746.1 TatD family hydrolase [Haoranjiania flava]